MFKLRRHNKKCKKRLFYTEKVKTQLAQLVKLSRKRSDRPKDRLYQANVCVDNLLLYHKRNQSYLMMINCKTYLFILKNILKEISK